MKLYLSDLDGTLLNKDAEISDKTAQILNKLIDEGLAFSVATARTAATVQAILGKINIKLPVILMNGVCVYDLKTKKILIGLLHEKNSPSISYRDPSYASA